MQSFSPKTTKGELTRLEIVRRAAPLFNRRGYAGTSLQHIMAATGLKKGGLYRHFAGKQELAEAAARFTLAQAIEARLAPAEAEPTPLARLRRMIHDFVTHPSPVAGGCPILNIGVDADDTNTRLLALAADGVRTWKQWIMRTIQAGRDDGSIRDEADPALIANQIIAGLEGALLLARIDKSRQPLQDARIALDQVLQRLQR